MKDKTARELASRNAPTKLRKLRKLERRARDAARRIVARSDDKSKKVVVKPTSTSYPQVIVRRETKLPGKNGFKRHTW